MCLCEFQGSGTFTKPDQAVFERFQCKRLISMRIPKPRRHIDDLCQSFRFLRGVLLFIFTQLIDPQPVPTRVHHTESTHSAVFFSWPQDAWNACNWQLAMHFSQPGGKSMIQTIWIRYRHNDSAIGILGIKSIHAE